MQGLESTLAELSIFEHLRADEIGRVAKRFEVVRLAASEARSFGATAEETRLVVIVSGHVAVALGPEGRVVEARLGPGDRFGDGALLAGRAQAATVKARDAAAIAILDRAGIDALLAEFPAIALVLATELSQELHAKDDAVRQLLELHAAGLGHDELASAIGGRQRALARHGSRVARITPRALFRRLVVQEGAEPPFWMLVGFIVSLGLARLTVYLILKFHLESQLFALVAGNDPNPKHIHHFNYGLILIGLSGLAALFPFGRRGLRILAFAFGFGAGLIFDEFALLWNLNPEYAQGLSLVAAGIAAAALVQLTYFRRFWTAIIRRAYFALRGGR